MGKEIKFLIAFFIFFIFALILMSYQGIKKDNACKEIGFENYLEKDDFNFCEDNNGNLYYVMWDYEDWSISNWDIYVKEINIGEVRVVK